MFACLLDGTRQKLVFVSSTIAILVFLFFCRAGQNTVEMLAIADKRVAELNDEIRMLEKQVS